MTYLKRSKKSNKKPLYIIGFIILLLILFNFFNVGFISDGVRWITSPVLKAKDVALKPFDGVIGYFKTKKSLENENSDLRNEISDLRNSSLQIRLLEVENADLRRMLGRQPEENTRFLSFVLSKPPFSPYDTLILDSGRDQISVGDKIYVGDIYLGEIVETNQYSSIAKLISSSDVRTEVLINGQIQAETAGMGGGTLSITLPKDEEINPGDVVSIPGPDRDVVGVIQEVESNEVSSFITAYLNIPVSLNKISVVGVVKY